VGVAEQQKDAVLLIHPGEVPILPPRAAAGLAHRVRRANRYSTMRAAAWLCRQQCISFARQDRQVLVLLLCRPSRAPFLLTYV
jgi:hypothetical protein